MGRSEAQIKADKKYLQKLDDIKVRVPAGKREEIANYAASRGESMNAFIIRAIYETMDNDKNHQTNNIE